MNRLTEEKRAGPWASLKNKAEAKPGAFADYECLMAHLEAVTRLAYYEDLEESGRLVVLPCKAGDLVYIPGHRLAAQIDEITIDATNGVILCWSEYEAGPELTELWDDGWFTPEDVGRTVFLTREEAEAALKEEVR